MDAGRDDEIHVPILEKLLASQENEKTVCFSTELARIVVEYVDSYGEVKQFLLFFHFAQSQNVWLQTQLNTLFVHSLSADCRSAHLRRNLTILRFLSYFSSTPSSSSLSRSSFLFKKLNKRTLHSDMLMYDFILNGGSTYVTRRCYYIRFFLYSKRQTSLLLLTLNVLSILVFACFSLTSLWLVLVTGFLPLLALLIGWVGVLLASNFHICFPKCCTKDSAEIMFAVWAFFVCTGYVGCIVGLCLHPCGYLYPCNRRERVTAGEVCVDSFNALVFYFLMFTVFAPQNWSNWIRMKNASQKMVCEMCINVCLTIVALLSLSIVVVYGFIDNFNSLWVVLRITLYALIFACCVIKTRCGYYIYKLNLSIEAYFATFGDFSSSMSDCVAKRLSCLVACLDMNPQLVFQGSVERLIIEKLVLCQALSQEWQKL